MTVDWKEGGGGSISFPYKGISNERPKKVKDGLNNSVLRSERRAPGWFMTKNEFRPPQSPYIKKWLVTSAIKSASTSLSLSLTLSLSHAHSLTHSHSHTLALVFKFKSSWNSVLCKTQEGTLHRTSPPTTFRSTRQLETTGLLESIIHHHHQTFFINYNFNKMFTHIIFQ